LSEQFQHAGIFTVVNAYEYKIFNGRAHIPFSPPYWYIRAHLLLFIPSPCKLFLTGWLSKVPVFGYFSKNLFVAGFLGNNV
jgi:hypothetical protein